MMTVLGCIVHEHNIGLVMVAALLCGMGSWVTATLYQRTASTNGTQRMGWHVLTALAGGVAIWCTHFVAMLGYHVGVPVGFDPGLTTASLLIAVFGATAGFAIAQGRYLGRATPAIGGAIVGLAIVAMHYTGMIAYRVQGVVSWDRHYLAASIVLAVPLAAAALHCAMQPHRQARARMATLLALAVVCLHFTGMSAFRVMPMAIDGTFSNPEALPALGFAVAGMALVIVIAGLVSYIIDDSARSEAVEKLRVLALNDTLTGLPNRANFDERLDLELDLARARQGKLALIGIDLNRFKEINDLRGHKTGDEVLRVLGMRLKSLPHEESGEFVARTGGDEFVAMYRIDETDGVSDFLARLETALFKPLHINDFEVLPGASIGVAIWPDDATDRESLVNNADLAMYRAKINPMRKVCYYEPSMDEQVRVRRNLAADLREALARDQPHNDAEEAGAQAARIIDALSAPYDLDHDRSVRIGASIGIALTPDHAEDGSTLLARADIALYAAKESGKGIARIFQPDMETRIQERTRLEGKLRGALKNRDGLFVFYQPIVDIETGTVTAREALMRWHHPKRGWISPAEFVLVAEQSGLIDQLGVFALDRACHEAAQWEDGARVAVNVSACQLGKGTLVAAVLETLVRSGLAPHRLELEITETALLDDERDIIGELRRLRGIGVRVALDDFGTGYSSLAHLRAFPFDKIKIDGSFVKDAVDRPDCAAVVKAIADLGKRLGVTTVAEGVETQAQLDRIREEGCREVQGYFFGRPMPSEADAAIIAGFESKTLEKTEYVEDVDNAETDPLEGSSDHRHQAARPGRISAGNRGIDAQCGSGTGHRSHATGE